MMKRVIGSMRNGYFKSYQLNKRVKMLLCTIIFVLVFTSCKRNIESDPIKNQSDNKNVETNENLDENENSNTLANIDENINESNKDNSEPKSESLISDENHESYNGHNDLEISVAEVIKIIDPEGQTIKERFEVLEGYERQLTEEDTFAYYLQNLPLKPDGTKVKYYDGRTKNKDVYLGVVDFSLGDRDLQQCADVVIRLRAEYLYENNRHGEIKFNFVSGFTAEFSKWSAGKGISVKGNTVSWTNNTNNTDSYESFE